MSARTVAILKSGADPALEDLLHSKGFNLLYEQILTITAQPCDFSGIADNAALIFTSAHAVNFFSDAHVGRHFPVYAVGAETAASAHLRGFQTIETADGTAEHLVNMLENKLKIADKPAYYIRGADISTDIAAFLAKKGINIMEMVAYRANIAKKLSENLIKTLETGDLNAVLFYSRRGAETFTSLICATGRAGTLNATKALCISAAVVKSVSVLPFRQCVIADRPGRHGMMELVKNISIS